MSTSIIGASLATPTPIEPALPGLAVVPTPVPVPVPAETGAYTVKLSQAAQAQQLESHGQSASEIVEQLGLPLD